MSEDNLLLTLDIRDPNLIAELSSKPDGEPRQSYALHALQIGVLSIQQAQSRIDADQIRREGERLVEQFQNQLNQHAELVRRDTGDALRLYFDPQDGRFSERLRRLIDQDDGELVSTMRSVVDGHEEKLDHILQRHVGPDSSILRIIDPASAQGLAQTLQKNAAEQMEARNAAILREFSLDNSEGALTRVVAELARKHGDLGTMLDSRIAAIAEDFSLDREDSALSRLVNRVDQSQSRISMELSLDVAESALSRMRREILAVLAEQAKNAEQLRTDLMARLSDTQARKEESERSTRHGIEFEASLYQYLFNISERFGDVCTATGQITGRVRNSRRGDFVIRLGPEHVAAGERIVVEAKQDASYTLTKALADMKPARDNRAAGVGIFVFSARTAPAELAPFARYDNDIVVVWNAENPASDLYIDVAVSLAKAMVVRARADTLEAADLDLMDKAVIEIARQAEQLSEIQTAGETAEKALVRIRNRARIVQEGLVRPVADLNRNLSALRSVGRGS